MLEFLFSKHEQQKPFINSAKGQRVLPVVIKDEVDGVIADIIKKLE